MAAADYRLCDVCGGKAFYDSNLNYENGPSEWNEHLTPYRTAGRPQYDTPEKVQKWGTSLDYLGDWAVICDDCAKTHKCIVVPIGEPPMTDHAARIFELEQSLTEQARLVGMGAEREAALLAKVAELERGLAEAREIIGDLVNHARGAEVLLKIPQQETTSKAVAFLADHAAMAREGEK